MSDLRKYISQIKKNNELKITKTKVSTKYEIAGITAKVDGSNAVLFENIRESDFRLIANLVGTRKRFALAVGGTEDNIHEKVISAIKKAKRPKIISELLTNGYSFADVLIYYVSFTFIAFFSFLAGVELMKYIGVKHVMLLNVPFLLMFF